MTKEILKDLARARQEDEKTKTSTLKKERTFAKYFNFDWDQKPFMETKVNQEQ